MLVAGGHSRIVGVGGGDDIVTERREMPASAAPKTAHLLRWLVPLAERIVTRGTRAVRTEAYDD